MQNQEKNTDERYDLPFSYDWMLPDYNGNYAMIAVEQQEYEKWYVVEVVKRERPGLGS